MNVTRVGTSGQGHTIFTSHELMWCCVQLRCQRRFNIWILWRRFTLLSLCLRHVISRGALVGSCASAPLKFLLPHTFRDMWRTCRALFRRYQLFPEMEETLIEKVRQRTFLYDTKSPDNRDQHMRANAGEGIGKELKIKRKFYVSSYDVGIVCCRLYFHYSILCIMVHSSQINCVFLFTVCV